jgi:hypothetical protein
MRGDLSFASPVARECALCEFAVPAEFYSLPGDGNASGQQGPGPRGIGAPPLNDG